MQWRDTLSESPISRICAYFMAYSISLPASVLSVTLNVRYDSSAKRRRSCYNLFPKCNPFISVHFEFTSFFFVNQELVVNNSTLGFYMVSPCIATLRRWCSKEMYCHDCEEIFSKKGKNDNGFQIIWNYEEKREVLKSSGTTRNNSGTNHRKKINVVGQETEIEFTEYGARSF